MVRGSILSLMSLIRLTVKKRQGWVLGIGALGASLFFSDAVITPAVSVLSEVEGLEIVAPHPETFVVPFTIGLLGALFCRAPFRYRQGCRGFRADYAGVISDSWFFWFCPYF